MVLEWEATEQPVGPFSADILCTNTDDDTQILIENQLEKTDHRHLGQLLTYAAGLDTKTIVWIAQAFTEEHQAAIDWLNEITEAGISFFGLEIELWRIGESLIAPKFNIISKPNEWSREVSKGAKIINTENLSKTKKMQIDYWGSFKKYGEGKKSSLQFQKSHARQWFNVNSGSMGQRQTKLLAVVNTRKNCISVGFQCWGRNSIAVFDLLHEQKAEIEQSLGFELIWNRAAPSKHSGMYFEKNASLHDDGQWQSYHQWMVSHLEKLDEVFKLRVKSLNLDDWVSPDD